MNWKKITKPQTVGTILIGLFFIFVLHFKMSYSLLPILLSIIGIGLIISEKKYLQGQLDEQDKWLMMIFTSYLILFIFSYWFHQGKLSELDLPSRTLLLLPVVAVCYKVSNTHWILYAIVFATFMAGGIGLVKFFILNLSELYPELMYIQAGDILMTLSLMSLTISFYFKQQCAKKWSFIALLATGIGIFACLVNQARGAWLVAPFIIILLFMTYRKMLSKSIVIAVVITAFVGAFFAGEIIQKRWLQAEKEVSLYIESSNGNTSVGARFDMWKSAWIGIQEKPFFGWGLEGVKQMRKMHYEQNLISKFASSFDHAHNQYLHDTSARGLLGLTALIALFAVPLNIFRRNMRQDASPQSRLWGMLGIIHILATMGYCLTQAFLSHNSGMMFYIFVLLICYGLQKSTLNSPLAGN